MAEGIKSTINNVASGGGGGSGTVTSVALTASALFDVTGSPITTSGTIDLQFADATANTVFAGPDTGAPDTPSFRALVADDIPNISAAKITSGTLAVAQGGTNIASYTGGDVLYASAATTISKLGIGSPGDVLTVNAGGTAPEWAAPAAGGDVSGPASATPNAHSRYSGSGGKTLKDGKWIEDDDGHVTVAFGDTGSTSTRVGWYPTITLDGGTVSSINAMERLDCSTEGSGAGAFLIGTWTRLLAGYTGNGLTVGHWTINSAAGTGTSIYAGQGNMCYRAQFGGSSSGHYANYYAYMAAGSTRNWGLLAEQENSASSGTYVGVGASLREGSGTFVGVPIWGRFGTINAAPTYTAAGVFDNGSSTHPGIAVLDNGTAMFLVADGGAMTAGASGATPTHRFNSATAGSAGASSGTYLVLNVNGTDYHIDLLATS